MIDALRLAFAWALVWLLGIALVVAMNRTRDERGHAAFGLAWIAGCGFFVGAFTLTLWMRASSLAGLRFSLTGIALPLMLATLALGVRARRALRVTVHATPAADRSAQPSRAARVLWFALLAWIALRFVVLLLDVIWTPLYPWDAWIQWATKARVWYGLGHLVPFGRSDAWFAANGAMWLDASPDYPATVPLWQVWSSIALGRWDDALMNVPWWLVAVALALAVYGALREDGASALAALVGAWLVSSLPLANVHVALAGYADLPMAAYYTVAAIAAWRWSRSRTAGAAALALLLALACTTIKTPGIVWALTLVPAVVLACLPQRGPRLLAIALAVILFALLVLAQAQPVVLGYRLHLDFAPARAALVESFFLLGNWNLLWYAVVAVAIVAWRGLRDPSVVALSATIGAGMLFLAIVFAFTNARDWVVGQTTINRATLHLAPLAVVWIVAVAGRWLREPQALTIPAGERAIVATAPAGTRPVA